MSITRFGRKRAARGTMLKVLTAEDDLMIADMAGNFLYAIRYEVRGIVRTVGEAVAFSKAHRPDLALIGLRLPSAILARKTSGNFPPINALEFFMQAAMSRNSRSQKMTAKPASASPTARRT